MEKRLIGRGLLAGAIGAVLAFVFARLFAEPVMARAIDFEDGRTDAENSHGVHEHGVELFTRGVQSNPGLGFGVLIFGLAMGALFAVLFCVVYARTARRAESPAPRQLSAAARGGSLRGGVPGPVPEISAESARRRPVRHHRGAHRLVSGAWCWRRWCWRSGRCWLARRLAERFGAWNSRLLAAAAYLVAVVVVMVLLPTVDETPEPLRDASGAIIYPGFPADVLYEFRLLSLGTQLLLWVTIGLVFAPLAGRLLTERSESGRVSSIAA